jgi:hypothetical protein
MKLTPLKLQNLFGGDAGEWGRIIIGQHSPHGEHLAICKEINKHGYDASFTLAGARKGVGKKTRKGTVRPCGEDVFNALEDFRAEKFAEEKCQNFYSEDGSDFLDDYYAILADWSEEPHYYESHEDEENTKEEFLNSLDDIVV